MRQHGRNHLVPLGLSFENGLEVIFFRYVDQIFHRGMLFSLFGFAPIYQLARFASAAMLASSSLFLKWGTAKSRSTTMPTRNVNLTQELDSFVLARVESGRFENASEVVRAALRTLEREELQYEAKLAALRTAIDEGDGSGVAEGNPFDRVRQ